MCAYGACAYLVDERGGEGEGDEGCEEEANPKEADDVIRRLLHDERL